MADLSVLIQQIAAMLIAGVWLWIQWRNGQ